MATFMRGAPTCWAAFSSALKRRVSPSPACLISTRASAPASAFAISAASAASAAASPAESPASAASLAPAPSDARYDSRNSFAFAARPG
eukprot:6214476-Pleurochrysis_carterae.AAC.2